MNESEFAFVCWNEFCVRAEKFKTFSEASERMKNTYGVYTTISVYEYIKEDSQGTDYWELIEYIGESISPQFIGGKDVFDYFL